MKRLPAFTLIELVVVMVISGIVVSVAYTAWFILLRQYTVYTHTQERVAELRTFFHLMDSDFRRCREIRATNGSQIIFLDNHTNSTYQLYDTLIIRTQHQETDTFHIAARATKFFLFKKEVYPREEELIDGLSFSLEIQELVFPFSFHKQYDAFIRMKVPGKGVIDEASN